MALRPDQMDKIAREINLRGMRCEHCRSSAFTVDHRLFEIKQASGSLGSVTPSSAEGLTLVAVSCDQCQRVQLFDAGGLGIS